MAHTLTRKEINELYLPPSSRIVEIDIPDLDYLVIDGEGDPAGEIFQHATKWLYATIIPLRKVATQTLGEKFPMPPLETLYWTEDEENLDTAPKTDWRWRSMIVLADCMDKNMIVDAINSTGKTLGKAPDSLRIKELKEGKCVQTMHIGSPKDLSKLALTIYQEYLPSHELIPNGRYHEIYLSYAKRVAPQKMRTVVRQPVKK